MYTVSEDNLFRYRSPASPPGSLTVLSPPDSASTLRLNWTEPTSPNGKIEEYVVYYTSDPGWDTKLWFTKTTQKKSMLIDSRAAPKDVTVSSLYGNLSTAVEVMWTRPEMAIGQVTGYMVYYTSDKNQSDPNWMIQSERGLSSLILGLDHNTTYFVKVRARYGASLGPFSDVFSFTTPKAEKQAPLPPLFLHLEGGNDHINASWDFAKNLTSPSFGCLLDIWESFPDAPVLAVNTTDLSYTFTGLILIVVSGLCADAFQALSSVLIVVSGLCADAFQALSSVLIVVSGLCADANATYTVSVKAFNDAGYSLPVVETFHTHPLTEMETTE
ncbi:hypothetical protein BaRGS_00010988 [Batillaria attramentaria]|uniref:Fibronectin type-III domain-containing protein n=1 Tax=Batillaria attramentaria TaxID=370345 RepID=A0ABD0LEH7_9CAEN